jgi:hypothetical protein
MAHYAFLDENNIVTEVIVGVDETELIEGLSPEVWYGNFRGQVCKRTSYNTQYAYEYEYDDSVPPKPISRTFIGSIHTGGGTPFRGTYAGVGDFYDATNDVFMPQGFVYDFATETFTPPSTPEDTP